MDGGQGDRNGREGCREGMERRKIDGEDGKNSKDRREIESRRQIKLVLKGKQLKMKRKEKRKTWKVK